MNKKLLTLAVAAAMAAPGFASAEAIMYGKLNVSLDYITVDNAVSSIYNNSARTTYSYGGVNYGGTNGNDYYYRPNGALALTVPTGTVITPAMYNAFQLAGTVRLMPGQMLGGQNYNGWDVGQSSSFWRQKGGNGAPVVAAGTGPSNRFGIKGSEDLGNGLKAIYQIEVGVNFDTNNNLVNNNDTFYWRNTFVGLAGDWGTALIGRHDTPLKISTAKLDLFADTLADMNATIGFQDLRADSAVAYISPSFSGFQFSAAIVPAGGSTGIGAQNINSDQINGGWSAAGIYKNGPFYASAAYESLNEEMFMNTATSMNGCAPYTYTAAAFTGYAGALGNATVFNCAQPGDSFNKWRFGLGLLDWNGFSLTGIYEQQENIPTGVSSVMFSDASLAPLSYVLPTNPDKRELWQIQAGYSFGNVMLKAMYGQTTYSGDPLIGSLQGFGENNGNMSVYRNLLDDYYNGQTSSWAIGADYNFSKRTTAYILYTATSSDQGDLPVLTTGVGPGAVAVNANNGVSSQEWDGFSIGLMHSF
jgi:predicted porin